MNDNDLMQRAFQLALKGIGQVSPNPIVWAVIVKNNKIIWEGYHMKYGWPHAEVNAINNSTESVKWATIYCSLEPCCHTNKQTPPCTDLIIKSGIKKVVISNIDPNQYVSWKGVKILEDNGIEVVVWVEEEKWESINEVFFNFIRTKLPFIHLKWAQTLDWKIATLSGDSKWITDEKARNQVHKLRLKYDAVMVWANTLNNDNPSLSIRMWVENSNNKVPYRIIFGNLGYMRFNSKIFNDDYWDKTIILSLQDRLDKIPKEVKDFFDNKKIVLIWCKSLKDWLIRLWERKITSILVEWWGQLITSFIKKDLYNRISAYIAPVILWDWISYYNNIQKKLMSDAIRFNKVDIEVINNQAVYNIKKII